MSAPDREYISQFSEATLGLIITLAGVPTDADGAVTLTVINEDTQQPVFSTAATHEGLGQYTVDVTPDHTTAIANYTALWAYQVATAPRVDRTFFAVGNPQLFYDGLDPAFKVIVDLSWAKFADQFDSPTGGPNLQTYYQSNWSKSRMAQALMWGLMRLNSISQPYSFYTIDGVAGPAFPVARWGGLLAQVTFVEALKHLQRSYLEQPDVVGANVTRLDRQRYYDRYGDLIQREDADLKREIETFKISQMFLGRPSILVPGGVFGRAIYNAAPYYAAARPSLWAYGTIA